MSVEQNDEALTVFFEELVNLFEAEGLYVEDAKSIVGFVLEFLPKIHGFPFSKEKEIAALAKKTGRKPIPSSEWQYRYLRDALKAQIEDAQNFIKERSKKKSPTILEMCRKKELLQKFLSDCHKKILEALFSMYAKRVELEENEESEAKILEENEESEAKILEENEESEAKILEENEESEAKILEENEESEANILEESEAKILEESAESEAKILEENEESEAQILQAQRGAVKGREKKNKQKERKKDTMKDIQGVDTPEVKKDDIYIGEEHRGEKPDTSGSLVETGGDVDTMNDIDAPKEQTTNVEVLRVNDQVVVSSNLRINCYDSGQGELNISTRADWIDVSLVRSKEEWEGYNYIQNLMTMRGHPCVVRLEYVVYINTSDYYLALERYDFTLSHFIETSPIEELWQQVQLYYGVAWKISPTFLNILRKIIKGVLALVKKGIACELSANGIVFSNLEGLQPKILDLFGLGGEKADMVKAACWGLKRIIDGSGRRRSADPDISITEDVKDFLLTLQNPSTYNDLLKHPVFWGPLKKLSYMISLVNLSRLSDMKFMYRVEKLFRLLVTDDWVVVVQSHSYLRVRLQYAREVKGKRYDSELHGLLTFIRDQFEHINEVMMFPDGVDESGNPKFVERCEYRKFEWDEIELLFEGLFPKLVTFLQRRFDFDTLIKQAGYVQG